LTKPAAKPKTTQNCKIFSLRPSKLIIDENCFSNIFYLIPSKIDEKDKLISVQKIQDFH